MLSWGVYRPVPQESRGGNELTDMRTHRGDTLGLGLGPGRETVTWAKRHTLLVPKRRSPTHAGTQAGAAAVA